MSNTVTYSAWMLEKLKALNQGATYGFSGHVCRPSSSSPCTEQYSILRLARENDIRITTRHVDATLEVRRIGDDEAAPRRVRRDMSPEKLERDRMIAHFALSPDRPSFRELGRRFGLSDMTIRRILRRDNVTRTPRTTLHTCAICGRQYEPYRGMAGRLYQGHKCVIHRRNIRSQRDAERSRSAERRGRAGPD